MHQFRYSRSKFSIALVTSAGLTFIVTFVVHLVSRLFRLDDLWIITWSAAIIFFMFFSARALWLFLQNDVILAVRPDGIFDARLSADAVLWQDIREISLVRRENDFQLDLQLWPNPTIKLNEISPGARPNMKIDLSVLDAPVETIVAAVQQYAAVQVRMPEVSEGMPE